MSSHRRPSILWTLVAVAVAAGPVACGYGAAGGYSSAPADYSVATYPPSPASSGPEAPPYLVEATPYQPEVRMLTAGMVADVDRRPEYLEYLDRHASDADVFGLDLSWRLRVTVLDAAGQPVNDALVVVDDPGVGRWAGRTHADGVLDWFRAPISAQLARAVTVRARTDQSEASALVPMDWRAGDAQVTLRLDELVAAPTAIDLGLLIDVTGSMEDELRYVNAEVGDIVRRIRASAPDADIRVGATLYRDRGDDEPLRLIPFTHDVHAFADVLAGVAATGGGDYPEDMNAGLEVALTEMDWRAGDVVRVLCLIADAPPQDYATQFAYGEAIEAAVADGIRILPVAASGADRSVEFLFRAMGAATSTPFVYLTDDSGIGNPHLEPDTERVTVEMFNDLLTRLVLDDLLGRGMHEPTWQGQSELAPAWLWASAGR